MVNRLHPDDAHALLGLRSDQTAGHTTDTVRAAFRQRLQATHPDRVGDTGHETTVALLDAYRIALDHAAKPSPEPPAAPPSRAPVWLIDRDTIALSCTHGEAFVRLVEVGHQLGAITYLDRETELLEVLLRTVQGDTLSLVISLQGRTEWIEAFLTVEVLDRAKHELPTIDQLTELVAHRLNTAW
jgi:hypothetical protein